MADDLADLLSDAMLHAFRDGAAGRATYRFETERRRDRVLAEAERRAERLLAERDAANATAQRLADENRLLQQRVEQLARFEPRLKAIEEGKDGDVRIRFDNAREAVQLFADAFWRLLTETSAENYVETKFYSPDGAHTFAVTVQRHIGKTPHEKRVEAEKAVERLRSKVVEIERVARDLDHYRRDSDGVRLPIGHTRTDRPDDVQQIVHGIIDRLLAALVTPKEVPGA